MNTELENQLEKNPSRRWRRLGILLLPLIVFAILVGFFLVQLLSGRDAAAVPSALIGQPAPKTDLPALSGVPLPALDTAAFAGQVTLVNVFASWCGPCREEHPVLMQLAEDERFRLAGLNYKDKPQNAARFLAELGNPYDAIGTDERGRAGIEWGVYGVPETFLVGRDGRILWKHVGPLSPETVTQQLTPALSQALDAPTS